MRSTRGCAPVSNDNILVVEDLAVEFATYGGVVQAVRGVSFNVPRGKTIAIVGESGCGKSVTMQSIMGLIPMPPGRITAGRARLNEVDILGRWQAEGVRGRQVGMIFQDPMTSLNPTMTIRDQIAEPLVVHRKLTLRAARKRAVELLALTRIPDAAERAQQYPHQFSGGMLQRAMIALALACEPPMLIADEPTTALDVTIQAQILELMLELQAETGMAIVLITHDLGVVARMADEVLVMYAGEIVERGSVDDVFYRSAHPYTLGLKHAMPTRTMARDARLNPIPGSPPDLFAPPQGCGYFARCPHAMAVCESNRPALIELGTASNPSQSNDASLAASGRASSGYTPEHQAARCWLQHPDAPRVGTGAGADAGLYQP